jgi:hypothetical protein
MQTSTSDYPWEWCADHGKPFPVTLPENQNLAFGGWWSGSPFMGAGEPLPPGEGGLNPIRRLLLHVALPREKELTNFDIFPGGMLSMMVVEPPGTLINRKGGSHSHELQETTFKKAETRALGAGCIALMAGPSFAQTYDLCATTGTVEIAGESHPDLGLCRHHRRRHSALTAWRRCPGLSCGPRQGYP